MRADGSASSFFAPLAQGITVAAGWAASIQTLALLTLMALPAAWVLRGSSRSAGTAAATAPPISTRAAVGRALADRSFLLSLVYAKRVIAVLLFLLAPEAQAVMLVFAAVMGLTFLSTVPPTAGLVAKLFGTAHTGTLFGLVMVTHQLGGFLGAWLGGKAFEACGSYDWMWYVDIVLAVGAALIHLPTREARLPARALAAT